MENKKRKDSLMLVIDKVVGDVSAWQETIHDENSLENLELLCDLHFEIYQKILEQIHNRQEYAHSVKRIGCKAYNYLKLLNSYLIEDIEE